jgi:hypothetical protein
MFYRQALMPGVMETANMKTGITTRRAAGTPYQAANESMASVAIRK